MGREDRWGDSMRVLWGSLGICPPLDHIGLPHHTAEALHSISLPQGLGRCPKTASRYGLSPSMN